jgi:predicted lysophospholipase L1 biosynthesis ABC-type transport system permease subunit
VERWPADYRVTLIVGVAVLLALGWFDTRVRSVARAQAAEVIAADREQFKRDAMDAAKTAAREGAEKAVREAVIPLQLEFARHAGEQEARDRLTQR